MDVQGCFCTEEDESLLFRTAFNMDQIAYAIAIIQFNHQPNIVLSSSCPAVKLLLWFVFKINFMVFLIFNDSKSTLLWTRYNYTANLQCKQIFILAAIEVNSLTLSVHFRTSKVQKRLVPLEKSSISVRCVRQIVVVLFWTQKYTIKM